MMVLDLEDPNNASCNTLVALYMICVHLYHYSVCSKGTNMQHSGNMGNKYFQTEFMAEIFFMSPVRAFGKVLLMKLG